MQKGVNTVGVYKSQNRLYFQRKRLAWIDYTLRAFIVS